MLRSWKQIGDKQIHRIRFRPSEKDVYSRFDFGPVAPPANAVEVDAKFLEELAIGPRLLVASVREAMLGETPMCRS